MSQAPPDKHHSSERSMVSSFRLALLVIEGYTYLFATILVFASVVAFLAWGVIARDPFVALVALFVGLPAVTLTGSAIRALMFRTPEPRGITVSLHQVPSLASLIEDVSRLLGSPRIHRVIIGTALNASAQQVSRFGILCPRNTLVVGYPLLIVLLPEQLRAVVAHEMAHFSHAHGRIAGWVYCTRLSWIRLATALNEKGAVPIFVRWFLSTYVPRLEAQSAAIAREQEFLADRCAAAIAGSRTTADALVAIEMGTQFLDEVFWRAVYDTVVMDEKLPQPFTEMRDAFEASLNHGDRAELLDRLLESSTAHTDAHPCLRDRLRAIGEVAHLPGRHEQTAGDAYLGSSLQLIAHQLDKEWEIRHGDAWLRRHAELRKARLRLAQLGGRTSLSAAELFERGTLLEELGNDDDALAAYQAALNSDAGHGRASLAAGRMLLNRGDEVGAALVDRSMQVDEGMAPLACALLVDYYERWNQPVEAQRYRARATRYATRTALATTERTTATTLDQFAPHDLNERNLEALLAALTREHQVRAALLVRKRLRHSHGSLFVLGVVADGAGIIDLANRIRRTEVLPADAQIIVIDRHQRALQTTLEAVPGAIIYSHSP